MHEGQQREQDVEIGRWPMGHTTEQASCPGQGNKHPDESVQRNQPGG